MNAWAKKKMEQVEKSSKIMKTDMIEKTLWYRIVIQARFVYPIFIRIISIWFETGIELLFNFKFDGNVKLKSLIVIGGDDDEGTNF